MPFLMASLSFFVLTVRGARQQKNGGLCYVFNYGLVQYRSR